MSKTMFLIGENISTEVKRLFESGEIIKCAVAFWGKGALEIFENCHKPIQIICNLESGGTNPEVIRELQKRKNIQIKTHNKIHAKVYLAQDQRAIIGSANFSSNGLSLECGEVDGWIEACVLLNEPELLRETKEWFDDLWDDASTISGLQLKKAEKLWLRRRNSRPRFSQFSKKDSLLKIFRNNRELFKDRKVYISLWRDESSPEADASFKQFKKENKSLKGSELGLYENWHDLPSDSQLIDLYYDRDSTKFNSFQGIFRIQAHPPVNKFRYKNGKSGFITICTETDRIDIDDDIDDVSLQLTKDEKKLLKEKINSLWKAPQAKGDDDGKLIPLYDAWPILFE